MRGHDASSNPGVFRGLINFSAALDTALKEHLEEAKVFRGTSKSTQNEILQTMFEVCQEEISKEIQETEYLSIIVDETSDVSNKLQMAIIFRYLRKGKPVERFWDFLNPSGHDAQTLASCILTELEKHVGDNKQKLISQTYDGATVLSGSSHGVQALVKETYEHAAYVHCYAHQLSLIMLNAASVNTNVRIFFANLQGICAFFSNGPERTAILDQIVKKELPHSAPTRWNFNSRSVCTVFEHRQEIIECMRRILNEFKNASAINEASGHIKIMTSKSFISWLNLFYKIMPHVDILSAKFQTREIDPVTAIANITSFETQISNIRNDIDDPLNIDDPLDIDNASDTDEPWTTKRRKTHDNAFTHEAKEVCDIVISQAKDRFNFTGHLIAATLFFPEIFSLYHSCFPEKCFKETMTAYPFFDEKKFSTELTVIYAAKDFRAISGLLPLYDYISQSHELSETFSETLKLLKILITIPMNSAEVERCFLTLKRIKTFLRNTMSQEKLSALAMLSKERDLIESIPTFNQRVIEKFAAAKDRWMDFGFK